MDESVRILVGLALVLAIVGAMTSMTILLSEELRKPSEAPAFLCLISSLVYLIAFAHSIDQRPSQPDMTLGAPSKHASQMSIDQPTAAQRYSFKDFLQRISH